METSYKFISRELELNLLEFERQKIQKGIDAKKTMAERNLKGQFSTPYALALEMLQYSKKIFPKRYKIRFFDPGFGTGVFYSALLQTCHKSKIRSAEGYEIDPAYGNAAKELWAKTGFNLHINDFTQVRPPSNDSEKPNLIVCNPPYVRHHHISQEDKKRLQKTSEKLSGIKVNGLSGLYCHFLLISNGWLAKNGIGIWLIPSEFMDVRYGSQIKEYLLNKVMTLRIHRFNPEDVQFEDALVSSAIVIFKKKSPISNHKIVFSYGGTLTKPEKLKQVFCKDLTSGEKWTRYPLNAKKISIAGEVKLSDLFVVKRGIATGSNKFFIISQETIKKKKIPKKYLLPILPSPRHLTIDEIQSNKIGTPLINKPLFLISCGENETKLKKKAPTLYKYFQEGITKEVSKKFLCKNREPWYAQEKRDPPLFLFTYMGRKSGNRKSLRFILNHSKAVGTNSYLLLYPKVWLKKLIAENPGLINSIWIGLKNVKSDELLGEGRVYGGGLYKLEPRELGNTTAKEVIKIIKKEMENTNQPFTDQTCLNH